MQTLRKFHLRNIEDVPEFCKEVIQVGGMHYVWWKTNTVLVRGPYPTQFPMEESFHITPYDELMMNIEGK